jgi:hypothetical protein
VPPILPLTADGRIFRAGGEPWRYKGVSSFQLLDLYARGGDWRGFLAAYDQIRINLGLPVGSGYNLVRVWPYVPRADWGAKAWDSPAPDVVVAFLAMSRGGMVCRAHAADRRRPRAHPQAKQLVAALGAARPPNLLVEIGNEPQVHKHIDTRALKADLDASGFLYASGDVAPFAFGSYVTAAHRSDRGWVAARPRSAGVLSRAAVPMPRPIPPHRLPAIADEPIRTGPGGLQRGRLPRLLRRRAR